MTQPHQIRARVLAAAEECLLEGGFGSARLHSTIARRAGLSRPTVYKYVGDQDAIVSALILREVTALLQELEPLLERNLPFIEGLVDVMAFVVRHGREHRLLQAALRDAPELVLPWFTTHADVLMERVASVALAYLKEHPKDDWPNIEPRFLVDASCRMALSLIFTNGLVDVSDPEVLRRYLSDFLRPVMPSRSRG
ncbi:TetR/AcrR family transcriptional regulator [Pseudonocardia eucalypti]|uniref:TetR/AcrR family transcriptional regulator n=1 Tax=Pseudonocardia eucalypti TaxID=648755 RepID=A0ABP9PZW2_9PSEU|nr:AcrR family transcriptional regulator [Pseudonocardia eucalypti]